MKTLSEPGLLCSFKTLKFIYYLFCYLYIVISNGKVLQGLLAAPLRVVAATSFLARGSMPQLEIAVEGAVTVEPC